MIGRGKHRFNYSARNLDDSTIAWSENDDFLAGEEMISQDAKCVIKHPKAPNLAQKSEEEPSSTFRESFRQLIQHILRQLSLIHLPRTRRLSIFNEPSIFINTFKISSTKPNSQLTAF